MCNENGTPGLHYARWRTLLNSAHIWTCPPMNRTYPQSSTLITNIPHCSTKFHMPFIVWVPSMLTVSGRDSISASPLCGFLRSSEHVGCSTPAWQTIAVVSKDSAGLWSGSGCNLNTSGSVVSARSLCEERQLWDELLKTFKYLVDQPFHIWQAVHMRWTQDKN